MIGDARAWRERLARLGPERPVVFIVGSGLSRAGDVGAWNVATLIAEAEKLLGSRSALCRDLASGSDRYQTTMDCLLNSAPDEVDTLVRRATLATCTAPEPERSNAWNARGKQQRELCAQLERRTDVWALPRGVEALAHVTRVLEQRRQVGVTQTCLITTNFDCLLEVAMNRAEVWFQSQTVVADESLRFRAGMVGIWHVHGYWTDEPTLHTRGALAAARARLRRSLEQCFDGAEIWVLGYGGWQDIIHTTLLELMREGWAKTAPRVAWAFYEDAETSAKRYADVINEFSALPLGGQVQFFAGVDLHEALPAVASASAIPPERADLYALVTNQCGSPDRPTRASGEPTHPVERFDFGRGQAVSDGRRLVVAWADREVLAISDVRVLGVIFLLVAMASGVATLVLPLVVLLPLLSLVAWDALKRGALPSFEASSSLASWAAAGVAGCVALATVGLPIALGILGGTQIRDRADGLLAPATISVYSDTRWQPPPELSAAIAAAAAPPPPLVPSATAGSDEGRPGVAPPKPVPSAKPSALPPASPSRAPAAFANPPAASGGAGAGVANPPAASGGAGAGVANSTAACATKADADLQACIHSACPESSSNCHGCEFPLSAGCLEVCHQCAPQMEGCRAAQASALQTCYMAAP